MNGKNNNHGKIVGIALIFSIAMVLSSFSASAIAAETRQDSELILRVAMQDDIKGLNPITVSDVWSWNVLSYIFDGPINVNPTTDELIPYLAIGSSNTTGTFPPAGTATFDGFCDIGNFGFSPRSEWGSGSTVGEAIIYYDFENVYWHDGVQMSIRDVMFSMHMTAMIPEWTSSMNPLKDMGGVGGNYSTTSWLHVYKVWESPDSKQAALKFVLQTPFADFFRSTLSTFLLPYHIWGSTVSGQAVDNTKIWCDLPGYDVDAADSWKVAPAQSYDNNPPIGNGPFKFESWEPGQLTKIVTWRDHFFREDYKYTDYVLDEFGKSLAVQPNIDAVTYKIYKTAEAAVLALKSNDIDYIAWSVPPTFVQELANEPGVSLIQSPEQGFFYLAYNMRRQSFGYENGDASTGNDMGKPFRKAVAHCIDKNSIVQRLLLNLGLPGHGPVSSISAWYNSSIPTYSFDPDEAKNILANAGYKVNQGGTLLTGDAAKAAAGDPNWWVNPDGSNIGSSTGGKIEILTPEANYDPIRAQAGLMIAQQLRDIGIYAESIAMDFGSIVDVMDQRAFDMYILGWSIGSDPTDFLHAFFHSSMSVAGQNYPGYSNSSTFASINGYDKCFDEVIDAARETGDEEERKALILEAQASICYDLPYDVLYFRTNIEAYRSDNFVGWDVGSKGSIFTWSSLFSIRAPSPYKTNAQFVSPPSAMLSNGSQEITVLVKDQDGNPINGASVFMSTTMGTLSEYNGTTGETGKFTTTFTAQTVVLPDSVDPSDPLYESIENERLDLTNNGSQAIISITTAKYTSDTGQAYDDAPARLTVVTVYPTDAQFLSVAMSFNENPDVIDDVTAEGTNGFTQVEVTVTDQTGLAVYNSSVKLTASPAILNITPEIQYTDANGKATFKIVATNLENNDGTQVEFDLKAVALHPDIAGISGENLITLYIMDTATGGTTTSDTPFPTFAVIASVFCAISVSYAVISRKKR